MRGSLAGIGGMAAMLAASIFMMEPLPGTEPEPGSARNRPSGSKPVSGGGARERARRLARMNVPAIEAE